jgi:hypothetical protein
MRDTRHVLRRGLAYALEYADAGQREQISEQDACPDRYLVCGGPDRA